MHLGLDIALSPERLDDGTPEETACFGQFTVRAGGADLTGGIDFFVSAYRSGPLVSGYHVAEWLAWNWWRLRYEPRSAGPDWWRAHKMNSIGEGYAWPNLTVFSDGVRTALLAEPSIRQDAKPFRYLGAVPCIVPSVEFEAAVDAFIPRILGRLRDRDVGETNLDRIWQGVLDDRADAKAARRRRLEALLGREPDADETGTVDRLLADAALFGEQAVDELAAEQAMGGAPVSADTLVRLAAASGSDVSLASAVGLTVGTRSSDEPEAPAWKLGVAAARALRTQLRLGDGKITDTRLAELAGTDARLLGPHKAGAPFSFMLEQQSGRGRVVLRSRWRVGRRFELARLIGERIVSPVGDALLGATRARTYRQKMQRAFAAELLSPFAAVEAMLGDDLSAEAQADVAEHFQVSQLAIMTLLMNNHKLERADFDEALGEAA